MTDWLSGNPRDVRVHLIADIAYQRRLVRFIENHDEPRAYDALGPEKSRPAIVLAATLPGATLLHDGQFEGFRAKLPVQIGRQPDEPVDEELVKHSIATCWQNCAPQSIKLEDGGCLICSRPGTIIIHMTIWSHTVGQKVTNTD